MSSSLSSPSHADLLGSSAAEILPGLFLSDKKFAANLAALQTLGITHIVNVTVDVRNYWDKSVEGQLPIDNDTEQADLSTFFDPACEFIDQALSSGHRVLVHCQQGISRSTTILIAYLVKHRAMTVAQAYTLVRTHRIIARPKSSFLRQLMKYAEKLGATVVSPMTKAAITAASATGVPADRAAAAAPLSPAQWPHDARVKAISPVTLPAVPPQDPSAASRQAQTSVAVGKGLAMAIPSTHDGIDPTLTAADPTNTSAPVASSKRRATEDTSSEATTAPVVASVDSSSSPTDGNATVNASTRAPKRPKVDAAAVNSAASDAANAPQSSASPPSEAITAIDLHASSTEGQQQQQPQTDNVPAPA